VLALPGSEMDAFHECATPVGTPAYPTHAAAPNGADVVDVALATLRDRPAHATKILVWQWGRRGAGPRFAVCLAASLRGDPGVAVRLSLNRDAEIMADPNPPNCEMPVRTYRGILSFLARLATVPLAVPLLMLRLCRDRPDIAICAMPGPLDLVMAAALRLLGSRLLVVVHEAEAHPGDGYPMQMTLQRLLCRCAIGLVSLSSHVGTQLNQQDIISSKRPLIVLAHPPFAFDLPPCPRFPGPPRLLFFGRLLPYKGLDLLAGAIRLLPPQTPIAVRIVGLGRECGDLDALRACHNVVVENRWAAETELGAVFGWADALILPYHEASQSGVAAAAIAAGRPVIATRVGGLSEQLSGIPHTMLCEPDPVSLAGAIRHWLETSPQVRQSPDAALAWRQATSSLLLAVGVALSPQPTRDNWRNRRWRRIGAPRRAL
jgi:glycosyltransferase involved in cell wall biosynthesis